MVAVSMKDWTREERVVEDDAKDPEDAMDALPDGGAEDDAEDDADALAAPVANTDWGEEPGIPGLRHRLGALSSNRPSCPPVPSAVAAATGPPPSASRSSGPGGSCSPRQKWRPSANTE